MQTFTLSHLIPDTAPAIAVAVSGGADSMALLHLTHTWCAEQQIPLTALTVDHALRPDSADEAQQVANWCAHHHIPHHTLLWQGDKPQSNLQEAARDARYALLRQWCETHNTPYLLTAHHQQDQAETVLLHLMRGSGVHGLAAMPNAQPLSPAITLVRPLLNTSPEQLRDYLTTHHIPWIEDPSNDNPRFDRVKIRQALSGYDFLTQPRDLAIQRLARTADHMRRTAHLLDDLTHTAINNTIHWHDAGYADISLTAFTALHEEIALRVLRHTLCTISGNPAYPRYEKLTTLYSALTTATTATLHGCVITRRGDTLLCHREPAAITDERTVHPGEHLCWDNRFSLTFADTLPHTYTLKPLGEHGRVQLKQQGLLDHCLLPTAIIPALPALWHLETCVLAPHIYNNGSVQVHFNCSPGNDRLH